MRILILRTSAMGDIVHSLPVLASLRRNLPEARIGWVVEEPFAPLLDNHSDLDAVFRVRLRQWRRGPIGGLPEATKVWRAINEFDPDVALDLMGNHKAGAIAAAVRVPRVIGLERQDRREPSSAAWMTDTVAATGTHTVDRTLSVLRGLDIEPGKPDFQPAKILPLGATEPPPEQPYFLVQIGTGWINKSYPPGSLGEVAGRIRDHQGINGFVAHGPGDAADAQEAMEASRGALIGTVPTGFNSLGDWLRQAALVIGGDTGPLHLADALGTAVLMIMGPTTAERHGPYSQPTNTLRLDLPCSPCYKRFSTPQSCMAGLPSAAIADHALRLLCGRQLTVSDTLLTLSEPYVRLCTTSTR